MSTIPLKQNKKKLKLQRPLKVLSLDFDFFLKFENDDSSVLSEFPDGTEAFIQYSDTIWASRIANESADKKISTVKCNEQSFSEVALFLNSCDRRIPSMAANSHVYIYDFVAKHMSKGQEVQVVNLDYHHDAYHTEAELNCGNWVTHLQNLCDGQFLYQWITSENGWESSENTIPRFVRESYRFKTLGEYLSWDKNYHPDLIFLCRSDVWVPPHLDGYFDMLLKFMASHFTNLIGEQRITKPRNISDEVKQLRQAYSKLYNKQ